MPALLYLRVPVALRRKAWRKFQREAWRDTVTEIYQSSHSELMWKAWKVSLGKARTGTRTEAGQEPCMAPREARTSTGTEAGQESCMAPMEAQTGTGTEAGQEPCMALREARTGTGTEAGQESKKQKLVLVDRKMLKKFLSKHPTRVKNAKKWTVLIAIANHVVIATIVLTHPTKTSVLPGMSNF